MADSTYYPNVMWPNYSASNVQKAATKENKTLGKDEFLKLLVTQLSNQDPMQPLEDKEFIAQMAQFTSVEQLMNISGQLKSMNQSLGSVSGLIGKQVSWVDESKTDALEFRMDGSSPPSTYLTGVVDSIVIRSGVQYAKIGDKEIELDKILQINNQPAETEPAASQSAANQSGASQPDASSDNTDKSGGEAGTA